VFSLVSTAVGFEPIAHLILDAISQYGIGRTTATLTPAPMMTSKTTPDFAGITTAQSDKKCR
jgi:hypothetical protein